MEYTAYDRLILAARPLFYWPMSDAAGNPIDLTPNGRDVVTLTGPTGRGLPGPQPGFGGGACWFNNQGAYRPTPLAQTTNLTMEAWVFLRSVGANSQGLLDNNGGGPSGYDLLIDTDRRVQGICQNITFLNKATTPLMQYEWNHVVMERGASAWTYWINGKRDPTDGGTTNPSAPGGTTKAGYQGNIDLYLARVAYYDRQLGATEIFDHYVQGRDMPPTPFLSQIDTPAFVGGVLDTKIRSA